MALSLLNSVQQASTAASGGLDPVPNGAGSQPTATPAPTPAPVAATPPSPSPAPAIAATPPPPAPAPGMIATPTTANGTGTFGTVAGNYDAVQPLDTVQGQLAGMLQTDSPVMRQAAERQQMAFAGRGLLNTSMAQQAAQEAVISTATPIATADAQTHNNARQTMQSQNFEVGKTLQGQDVALQGSYQTAVQAVSTNYQKMIDTINASQMTPEDKSVAIQQAAQARDGELVYTNNLYSNMPRWQNEWLTAAVPTRGADLSKVTNQDTLGNIVNDPAQSAAARAAAQAGYTAMPGSAPTGTYSGAPQGATADAQAAYVAYKNGGGTMSFAEWNAQQAVNRYGFNNDSNYGAGSGTSA